MSADQLEALFKTLINQYANSGFKDAKIETKKPSTETATASGASGAAARP